MGALIEKLPTGDVVEVHKFDQRSLGLHYITVNRGYVYDRREPWGLDGDIYFYNGPQSGQRASLRKYQGYWSVAFWERP